MRNQILSLTAGLFLLMHHNTITPGCDSCESAKNKRREAKASAKQNNKDTQNSKTTKKGSINMTNIKRTSTGLGYEVIKPGTGAQPKPGQTVTVHYTGWLDDNGKKGKKFDSSVDRSRPFSTKIGIGHVIKGWDEGILMMKTGEKAVLHIPAKLGYGETGAGNLIPPHADLIFEVELISIN